MISKTPFSENMISVSEINAAIKVCVDSPIFKNLEIFGEVSGFRISGQHAYFTLKDKESQIACSCFYVAKTYVPKDGESVIIKGGLDYYVKGGKLSLIANSITPVGQGLLFLEFERLKAKLSTEGLFDVSRKKPLPKYPKEVCVVTSKSGAVIRDIVTTVRRKNPVIDIIVRDVRVQGENAAKEICGVLKRVDTLGFDVIILARGGGSLEDLAPFYDEELVRTVSGLVTPLVSAIGHETDFSLVDFVSDARAATPTAAAELVAYDYYALRDTVSDNAENLINAIKKTFERKSMRCRLACQKLTADAEGFYVKRIYKVSGLASRLTVAASGKLERAEHRFEKAAEKLDNLSPLKTFKRGYFGLTQNGRQIVSVSGLKRGDEISACGADGTLLAKVLEVTKKSDL